MSYNHFKLRLQIFLVTLIENIPIETFNISFESTQDKKIKKINVVLKLPAQM